VKTQSSLGEAEDIRKQARDKQVLEVVGASCGKRLRPRAESSVRILSGFGNLQEVHMLSSFQSCRAHPAMPYSTAARRTTGQHSPKKNSYKFVLIQRYANLESSSRLSMDRRPNYRELDNLYMRRLSTRGSLLRLSLPTRIIQAEGDDRPSRLALIVPLVPSYLIQDEP
jgi:hypothetical protein